MNCDSKVRYNNSNFWGQYMMGKVQET